ncbi:MAG: transposase [Alphaproteobacteria bacterium]|nr:transposase [Alphaproteobacteria bacterium]MBV9251207.1 transposase [Acetobacteraceae bacterium]MBV9376492.1 transposase [Alphaproteobacteria bacterium]
MFARRYPSTDFRRDNRKAFRSVFRQFVLLCKQLDLFGRELLAVDGTRIKAVNNKDRNFTRASLTEFIKLADEKLDDYLRRLDQSDAAERATGGARVENLAEKIAAVRERRERCKAMLAELDRTGENQISLTDPDSPAMAAHTHVAVGYNVQVAVDTKHKLAIARARYTQSASCRHNGGQLSVSRKPPVRVASQACARWRSRPRAPSRQACSPRRSSWSNAAR